MARGWTGVGPAERSDRHLFACSQDNCYRRLTFKTVEEALFDEANHACPWGTEYQAGWFDVTQTLVGQLWEKLDNEMDGIMAADPDSSDKMKHSQRARAFAESIAIFMPPFFTTADEVAKEAKRRYDARKAGEDYETPGLGSRRYEGAVRAAEQHASAAAGWYGTPDGTYTSQPERAGEKAVRASRTKAAVAPAIKLTEQEQTAIKAAHEQMPTVFTPEVLAKNYGVSVAVVKQVISA